VLGFAGYVGGRQRLSTQSEIQGAHALIVRQLVPGRGAVQRWQSNMEGAALQKETSKTFTPAERIAELNDIDKVWKLEL
jgi:hypothetical protein